MKRTIIKIITFITVFFVSLIVISKIMNKGNLDLTQEVTPASYPVAYMMLGGERCNAMLGYAQTMEPQAIRESISPIGEDRSVSMEVDLYGNKISKVSYEVRSIDGQRLVESTQVFNYTILNDLMKVQFSVKDLITTDKQYTLVLLLEDENGEIIRYYTRMVQTTKYHLDEYIAFVKEFHDATFNKDTAPIIKDHVESNSSGDNTTFAKVNIHSKADQITWGSLNIVGKTTPVINIVDIGTEQASLKLQFFVYIEQDGEKYQYRVEEFFWCRYTSDRMYLLDYERTMNQLLLTQNTMVVNDKIMLGISTGDIELVENEAGTSIAFGENGILYAFHIAENKLAVLYNPYETGEPEYRTVFGRQKCKVLSVSETGDVLYIVYGHLSQGNREGQVGIQVFEYDATTNSIEEKVFVPYSGSESILMAEVDRLAYANVDQKLFFILGGKLYRVNLNEMVYDVMAENLLDGTYQFAEDHSMIVWQEIDEEAGEDSYSCKSLVLYNLITERQTKIEAAANSYIKPLGFMGNDLIYGEAYRSEITTDHSGKIVFPMYLVKIEESRGNVMKEYRQQGISVVDLSLEENLIILKRMKKIEGTSQYMDTTDDQIICSETGDVRKNEIVTVSTANLQKIMEISLTKPVTKASTQKLTPKQVITEERREVDIRETIEVQGQYYVYSKDGLTGIYQDGAEAIRRADEEKGVVISESGEYVWRIGNRLLSNQIMAFEGEKVTEEKNSLAVCLDSILAFEGITRNTEKLLQEGQSPMDILENNLRDCNVLYLAGCSLSSVLYFVNAEYPVLAILKDGSAVLIVGYNQQNTVLMNPQTGTVYKKGIKDSTEWFGENGNVFITYIHDTVAQSEQ